jgi:hypothetical protein
MSVHSLSTPAPQDVPARRQQVQQHSRQQTGWQVTYCCVARMRHLVSMDYAKKLMVSCEGTQAQCKEAPRPWLHLVELCLPTAVITVTNGAILTSSGTVALCRLPYCRVSVQRPACPVVTPSQAGNCDVGGALGDLFSSHIVAGWHHAVGNVGGPLGLGGRTTCETKQQTNVAVSA